MRNYPPDVVARTVAGFDPGSEWLGQCALRAGELVDLKRQRIVAATLGEKLRIVYRSVMGFLEIHGPHKVGIEAFFVVHKAPHAGSVIGEVRGVIRLACIDYGIEPRSIIDVNPVKAKQAVTGKGNAPKGLMQMNVASMFKLDRFPAPDEADAAAIALSVS